MENYYTISYDYCQPKIAKYYKYTLIFTICKYLYKYLLTKYPHGCKIKLLKFPGSDTMSKQETLFSAQLNEAAVDRCSETVRNYLNAKKIDKRDVSRYALSVEEILLKTMDADNEERNVSVFHGKKFFRSYIGISVSGSAANVFAHSEREGGIFGSAILRNLGLSPDYTYLTHDEENQYLFSYHKKQISPLLTLIIAFAAAILVGILGLLLPANTLASINNGLMEPLHTTFLNILSCIAGPMIFLSVAWGIYGIGDAAALKRIGKNMMLSFFLTILAGVVVLTGLTLPFFDLDFFTNQWCHFAAFFHFSNDTGYHSKKHFQPLCFRQHTANHISCNCNRYCHVILRQKNKSCCNSG